MILKICIKKTVYFLCFSTCWWNGHLWVEVLRTKSVKMVSKKLYKGDYVCMLCVCNFHIFFYKKKLENMQIREKSLFDNRYYIYFGNSKCRQCMLAYVILSAISTHPFLLNLTLRCSCISSSYYVNNLIS